ncbi:hypothetical protein KDK95_14700 [Actinospica sp. MGRD01-02]|uniref:Uncharacterized protein n=1 Tax=Actinospica acidithermotolerans TaxID=2828514 RepID=A0A941IGM5_9ACTN|nr:hypothetical protein [Actinospica acidithermotolerans]MBR7827565.1 hypothetical protein [Actinospica acidithermotolerans]
MNSSSTRKFGHQPSSSATAAGSLLTVRTTAFQGEDGSLYYTVNRSKSYPGMDDVAKSLGHTRRFGTKRTGPEQTDAEQIMLTALDKGFVPNAARITTSRKPCEEFRNNGKPALYGSRTSRADARSVPLTCRDSRIVRVRERVRAAP